MRLRLLLSRGGRQLLLLNRNLERRYRLLGTTQQQQQQQHEHNKNDQQGRKYPYNGIIYGAATLFGIGGGVLLFQHLYKRPKVPLKTSDQAVKDNETDDLSKARLWHITKRADLPTYSNDEVSRHNEPEVGIWITYGLGVYDVTEFAPNHPGGNKIMMAAGAAIDPFWAIYQQHNTAEVLELLEGFRIGNLNQIDVTPVDEQDSPWSQEPKRHPLLKATSERPFNAEPPIAMLAEKFHTPNEYFYVRNHLPVPTLQAADYELELEVEAGAGAGKPQLKLTLDEIKALPKHTVTAAVMCGGNRRSEMTRVKPVKGECADPIHCELISFLNIFLYAD